jgi:tRNA G46 methylase TrmB
MTKFRSLIQIITLYRHFRQSQIINSLSKFYDQAHEKRTDTRIREWPEFALIGKHIEIMIDRSNRTKDNKTMIIVELGCGDGRFAQYLSNHLNSPFLYV